MAALVGRRLRTLQPQQAPLVDWSNPITAGLIFAYSMGVEAMGYGEDGRSVVQYQKSDGTIVGIPVNTNTGTAVRCLSGSGVAYACSLAQTSAKAGSYSLFAFATGPASGTQSALDDDDGITRRFQFRLNAGKTEFIPFYSGGNGSVGAASTLSAYDLANGFAMGASVNGTSYAVYQKGVKASATLAGVALAPNPTISVGARKSTVQQWTNGGIQFVAMWNRPLTDAEHQSLADNPWQLFKAAPRRLWLAYSASAPVAPALSGSAAAVAQAYGSLTTAIPIGGTAAAVATASGGLTTSIPLTGSASAQVSASGTLSTAINLVGTAAAVASASGDLATPTSGLSGAATATATGSATLTTSIKLSGSASATASAWGDLTVSPVTPTLPNGGSGGGVGPMREVRAFAELLDQATKPTRRQKRERRKMLEAEALELLPDLPALPELERIAPIAARIVFEQESQARALLYAPRPVLASQPVVPQFDARAALREVIDQMLAEVAAQHVLEAEDDFDTELLLLI